MHILFQIFELGNQSDLSLHFHLETRPFIDWNWNDDPLKRKCKIGFPANIYMSQINKTNTRKRCKTCSKLTIKTPEQRQSNILKQNCSWKLVCFSMYDLRRSGVFIVNIFYSTPFSCVSIVNFEQVNVFRVATTNASLKTNN